MKITAAKQELAKSLNIVLKAVPSKTTMNILYCVLIDATVDTIKLTGNDMELGIETEVKGTIEERGLICLDAKLFSEIIRKMPEDLRHALNSNRENMIKFLDYLDSKWDGNAEKLLMANGLTSDELTTLKSKCIAD